MNNDQSLTTFRVGDVVINELTGNEGEIVNISNRNYYEKPNIEQGPKLLGNVITIYIKDTNNNGAFEDCYEFEVTKK